MAGGRLSRVVFVGLYLRGDVGGDCVDAEYVLVLPAYPCKVGEKEPDTWVCVSLGGCICNVAISEKEPSIDALKGIEGEVEIRRGRYVSIR